MSEINPTVRVQKRYRDRTKTRLILFGMLALVLLACSIFSESLCPYDPNAQNLDNALAPPSPAHIFGTDRYGRDLFSRVLIGSRTSIFSTLLLVAVITVFGTAAGSTGHRERGTRYGTTYRVQRTGYRNVPGASLIHLIRPNEQEKSRRLIKWKKTSSS